MITKITQMELAKIAQVMPTTLRKNIKLLSIMIKKQEIEFDD